MTGTTVRESAWLRAGPRVELGAATWAAHEPYVAAGEEPDALTALVRFWEGLDVQWGTADIL